MEHVADTGGARYATSFDLRAFGAKCVVEVIADLATRRCGSTLSMTQALSSRPAFSISLENLRHFVAGVHEINRSGALLGAMVEGAIEHQLNLSFAGATLIVVQPAGKGLRFSLRVGLFHREGSLDSVPFKELEAVIKDMESLEARVVEKLESGLLRRVAAAGG
jgi:hypothetical protein